MTNTLSVDQAITKLADSYKIWTIGAGRTQQVLPQQAFREGADRNYNLKGSPPRKYLQWEEQTFGINLGWSTTPVHEWQLLGGINGTPVRCGDRLAIHNLKAGSPRTPGVLIHFDGRSAGTSGGPTARPGGSRPRTSWPAWPVKPSRSSSWTS